MTLLVVAGIVLAGMYCVTIVASLFWKRFAVPLSSIAVLMAAATAISFLIGHRWAYVALWAAITVGAVFVNRIQRRTAAIRREMVRRVS